MTSLKTSIKTITYLSDTGCLEIQGASLQCKRQGTEKNPMATVNAGDGYPVAILNRNEPAFYCVPAEL